MAAVIMQSMAAIAPTCKAAALAKGQKTQFLGNAIAPRSAQPLTYGQQKAKSLVVCAALGPREANMDRLVKSLSEKSIVELRALGRERGIRGDTKKELILALAGVKDLPKAAPAAPSFYSNGAASKPAASAKPVSYGGGVDESYAKVLATKSMLELRTLAKEKGLRGDTKKELIQLLAGSGGGSSSSSSSSSYSYSPPAPKAAPSYSSNGAASSGGSAEERVLLAKPLLELRKMARAKGLRGDTKKELIQLLLKAK